MRELLESLARKLVDEPDRVSVDQFEEDDGTIVLELAVAEDDYGKIIGRGGRTPPRSTAPAASESRPGPVRPSRPSTAWSSSSAR